MMISAAADMVGEVMEVAVMALVVTIRRTNV